MPTLGVASVDALPTVPTALPEQPGGRVSGVRARLWASSEFEGVFTPAQRRLGVLWVIFAVPPVAFWGALLGDTRDGYVFVFTFFASGAFTLPALVTGLFAVRRGAREDRSCHVLWLIGLALTITIGLCMLVGLVVDWRIGNTLGVPVVGLTTTALMGAAIGLVRGRSGRRALSVDAIEAAMATVVVVAPCVLLWGARVVEARDAWFAVPAACAAVALVCATYWTIGLYLRRGPDTGVLEPCGIALSVTGAASAVAHVAQGVSGFSLPAVPLLLVHAVSMSMLFLVVLFVPRTSVRGLDHLPPQAQVRGGGLAATMTLAGVPVLLVTTWAVRGERSWAAPFLLGVMSLLLVLAAVRHLLAVRETHRLYGHLESASEDRRRLLAQVIQRSDDDRHRVAAELHEQAVSAYASFVSFIQAAVPRDGAAVPSLSGMSTVVRDDLERHADSLRQLMLAIKPLEPAAAGSRTLAAPIRAYVDNLYGDRAAPRLQVSVTDGLVLDWVSETIALRIVQEALRNVWRHSRASCVDVSIGMGGDGRAVEVRVVDDGVGFDPTTTLFESGIGAMRSFAGVLDGRVAIDSAVGVGTSVVACLGRAGAEGTAVTALPGGAAGPDGGAGAGDDDPTDPTGAPAVAPSAPGRRARPHLRLVETGASS